MTDPTLLPTIERILDGIDRTEDTPGGWWETSTGAEHGAIARAALASPPATEERCGFPDCGGVRDDVFHEPCLTGGVFHDVKTCHPFTPSAPEPPAALVEAPGYLLFRGMRERDGMTLRVAADRLGIDFTYLSKVEKGHERPSDALVRKMGALYRFDAESMIVMRAAAEVPGPVRDAIVAAARADVDVERLARALGASVMLRAITGRVGRLNGAWYDKVAAEVAAAYREDPA